MSSCNGMVLANVPFFDGKNFDLWRVQMKLFLEYQGVLDVVERGIPPLVEQATESQRQAFHEAEKKDRKALYFIHQGTDNVISEKIAKAKTAKEAWDILQTIYQPLELQIAIAEPNVPSHGPEARVRKRPSPSSTLNDREIKGWCINQCTSMYSAAMEGDWKTAKAIISQSPSILHTALTTGDVTALHIAAAAKQKHFVKKLIERMNEDDLELEDVCRNTALYFAAASGDKKIAELMVNKNARLPLIRGNKEFTPLLVAASFGHRQMVLYLYDKTDLKQLGSKEVGDLFFAIIEADIYDIALDMLRNDKSLALFRNQNGVTALHLLARKPIAIASKSQLGVFKRLIRSCCTSIFHNAWMRVLAHQLVEELWEEVIQLPIYEISAFIRDPSRLLFDAAASGNAEFLVILLRSYPNLIWEVDSNRSLFHVAAIYRQERIFNIGYELGAIKEFLVSRTEYGTGNTMLHLVASLPSSERLQIVSGPALQMQRELLWFEAAKDILPISHIRKKNNEGKLAQELFTIHHKELQKEGEKWLKDTATSCMIVATLVATVVFASTFTVPGGNNSETGTPILERDKWFNIFAVSDAIALCTSSLSVVLFLSILTSRYAESDFRWSLPLKLMFGLLALAISISAMLLAFSASFFLVYNHKVSWIPILNISMASVTAMFYGFLHGRLLFDTICSTISSSILFRSRGRMLYR